MLKHHHRTYFKNSNSCSDVAALHIDIEDHEYTGNSTEILHEYISARSHIENKV